MRGVVRDALKEASENGLPGDHHFYITFRTNADGVEIPNVLRLQYPDEMTIVIQHRYWNLMADERGFAVSLSFSGRRDDLYIPYDAMIRFVDPSVDFGLQFASALAAGGEVGEEAKGESDAAPGEAPAEESETERESGAEKAEKIISLDSFRKK